MNIGEVWAAFRIDGSKAKADATKAGEQAGDAASTAMGARIKKGAGIIGSALAAGLTVALTGRLLALERATADFRKETGATADEAARASKAINDMAGRNLQPIEEIGATLTKVHTDLGLTGDQAERVTEQFLKFGQATGQDATEAVLAFDDVLDAWGLTADDAQGIMDALIVSHQRYGGSIQDNQRMLSQLAPSLKAANLDWEQANGLLNLFARAGVDSEAATTAFNRAVSKVHSPEELQTMLEQIAATKDDFDRAKLSAELFGNRAGPKLALALADSGGDLDAFTVKVGDVKGATDEAADASLTMSDRIKQALSGIVSTATEVLGPAGPLLTALGGLGSLFGPALGKAFKAVVGPSLMGALKTVGINEAIVSTLGTRIGGIVGKAAGAAAGLALLVGIAFVADQYDDDLARIGRGINEKLFPSGNGGALAGTIFDSLSDALHEAWYQIGVNDPLQNDATKVVDKLIHDATDAVGGDAATLDRLRDRVSAIVEAALASGKTVDQARAAGQAVIDAFVGGLGGGARTSGSFAEVGTEAGKELMEAATAGVAANGDHFIVVAGEQGEAAAGALAGGVLQRRNDMRAAFQQLMDAASGRVTAAVKTMTDSFTLAPVNMKDAIKNGKAAIVSEFRDLEWQIAHPDKVRKFEQWLGDRYDLAMAEADKATARGRPDLAAQWRGVAADIKAQIDGLPGHAATVQQQTVTALMAIMPTISRVIATIDSVVANLPIIGSPPPHRAMGGPVDAGVPYIVGEHRPELFVPDRSGYILPDASVVSGGTHSTFEARLSMDPATIDALRAAQFDADRVGEVAGRVMGNILRGASDSAHIGSLLPRGI